MRVLDRVRVAAEQFTSQRRNRGRKVVVAPVPAEVSDAMAECAVLEDRLRRAKGVERARLKRELVAAEAKAESLRPLLTQSKAAATDSYLSARSNRGVPE